MNFITVVLAIIGIPSFVSMFFLIPRNYCLEQNEKNVLSQAEQMVREKEILQVYVDDLNKKIKKQEEDANALIETTLNKCEMTISDLGMEVHTLKIKNQKLVSENNSMKKVFDNYKKACDEKEKTFNQIDHLFKGE